MDDFVKILLGVAFVGFSIYNSARKKKAKINELAQKKATAEKNYKKTNETIYEAEPESQINYNNSNEDLSFFDIIKKEVTDYEQNIATQNITQENNIEPIENEIEETIDVEFNDNKTHSSLRINEDDFLDYDEIKETEEAENIDFDLEKAVIYSEILKPKYF